MIAAPSKAKMQKLVKLAFDDDGFTGGDGVVPGGAGVMPPPGSVINQ
jgi:hypothetical protein